jgi:N-acetylglucosaminyldiphosphoundecaprenol N-acetyl-beta-D-mannosaminyltransferase
MRQYFLGCPIDILTTAETVNLAREAMLCRQRLQHVALNVAKLVNMRRNDVLAADVAGSDLITMDGMGIVWGARLLGLPAQERVTGIDLFAELLTVCARDGFKPYLLGATASTLALASERMLDLHPSLRFAGKRDGFFTPEQERSVVDDIRTSGADCLFIGMPTPKKERFLAAHRDELNVPFIMGVGGSFDIFSGQVSRAPEAMRTLGLEWLYRIYQEPRRMWWRYAETNALFAGILAQALVKHGMYAMKPRVAIPNSPNRSGG